MGWVAPEGGVQEIDIVLLVVIRRALTPVGGLGAAVDKQPEWLL